MLMQNFHQFVFFSSSELNKKKDIDWYHTIFTELDNWVFVKRNLMKSNGQSSWIARGGSYQFMLVYMSESFMVNCNKRVLNDGLTEVKSTFYYMSNIHVYDHPSSRINELGSLKLCEHQSNINRIF